MKFLLLLLLLHYTASFPAIRPYPAVEEVYAAALPHSNPSHIHWTIHCRKKGGRYKKRYC